MIVAGIVALAWRATGDKPPLRVRRVDGWIIVDVQTLGEYETTVAEMRLSRGHEVLLQLEARGEPTQIHTIGLPVDVSGGVPVSCGGQETRCERPLPLEGYVVTRPASGSFALESGARYRLEVWGRAESWWSKASATIEP
jgi:hypothetical protein